MSEKPKRFWTKEVAEVAVALLCIYGLAQICAWLSHHGVNF